MAEDKYQFDWYNSDLDYGVKHMFILGVISMTTCLFCEMTTGKVATQKIYEDDYIFVIHDINPKAKVHLLVIPKVHIPSLLEVQEEHANLMGYVVTSLKNFAKAQNIDSFRTIINTGSDSGQEIAHLHFHLLGGNVLAKF